MKARMGLPIGTLLAVGLLVWLALDGWGEQDEQPQDGTPLTWKQQYQESLWQPLRGQLLTLADVGRTLDEGRLWMISANGEPKLVSRHPLDSDGQHWRVQAVIGLDQQQTDSLVEAQAWQPDMADQPVSPEVAIALAQYPVERLSLIPEQPLTLATITATFGTADWQMPVAAGEAWIYVREGVAVSVSEDEAHSIMFGLRQE